MASRHVAKPTQPGAVQELFSEKIATKTVCEDIVDHLKKDSRSLEEAVYILFTFASKWVKITVDSSAVEFFGLFPKLNAGIFCFGNVPGGACFNLDIRLLSPLCWEILDSISPLQAASLFGRCSISAQRSLLFEDMHKIYVENTTIPPIVAELIQLSQPNHETIKVVTELLDIAIQKTGIPSLWAVCKLIKERERLCISADRVDFAHFFLTVLKRTMWAAEMTEPDVPPSQEINSTSVIFMGQEKEEACFHVHPAYVVYFVLIALFSETFLYKGELPQDWAPLFAVLSPCES